MSKAGDSAANVFANRNFRLVFFGALASELGALLYSFAVSFYILEISGNNALLQGVYLAVCGGVLLVFTPVGGVLGDRFDKAKIMYVCDFVKGGLILAATGLMLLCRGSGAHIVLLFIVGAVGNAVSGIFNPASGALLPRIVEERQLQQANADFSVMHAMESILGVVLAGVLYALLPVVMLFALVGGCYVLSGISEMFIRCEHVPSGEKLTLRLAAADMREGLAYLRGQRAVMALMTAIVFINFFISPVGSSFIPYFVKTDIAAAPGYLFDRLLTPELWSSVFEVMIGISSLGASLILGVRAPEEKCGRKTAWRLCAIAAVMLSLTGSYGLYAAGGLGLNGFLVLFCLGCLLIGFFVVFINVPVNTVLMRLVDPDKLSKVSSILSVVSQGLIPIASVLSGAVLRYFGSGPLLLACSLGFTITALFLLFNRPVREI